MCVHLLPLLTGVRLHRACIVTFLAFITAPWSLAIHFVAVVDPYNRQCQLITSVRSMHRLYCVEIVSMTSRHRTRFHNTV